MLFKIQHVDMICEGEKTETRRLGRRRWKLGNRYRVYTRPAFAKPAGVPFATIRILEIRQERLRSVDEAGAKREGYPDRDAYLAAFHKINRTDPDVDPLVWVLTFEVVQDLRASWRKVA
jgi:hypothetical protein